MHAFVLTTVALMVAALVTPAIGGAASPGTVTATNGTIPVAGLGYAANFADAGIGAQARFQRANQDHEIKGYTIDFKEFADDKNDPATAISEARRLVTQDGIFALVPDVSQETPGDFLTQQQVPWFGPGFDISYCPAKGVAGWGFSQTGCVLREDAKRTSINVFALLAKDLASKGISKPTIALIGTDTNSGKNGIQGGASAAEGSGFDVVYAKGVVPAPPAVVGDYTPYVQDMLTSNHGGQPDIIYSQVPPSGSLAIFSALKGAGFTGKLLSPYYSTILLKVLTGSYVFVSFAGFETQSKGVEQLKADVEAFKPGTPPSLTLAGGYFAADMFIQAVKRALKSSRTLTTAAVQKAASQMTYAIEDTIGPTSYPASYQIPVKACSVLVYDGDGTAFTIAQPYTCSTKTYPILPKFAQG
jgi:ABC-type branched-subunit amino acid transport system substrate-binding protein